MTLHADTLRLRLAAGPKSGSKIATEIGLSQPTVTRALAAMGEEVIKIGQKSPHAIYCVTQVVVSVKSLCTALM